MKIKTIVKAQATLLLLHQQYQTKQSNFKPLKQIKSTTFKSPTQSLDSSSFE